MRSTQQIIELNKGDVLLSGGDFAFAAAGNSAYHVCVHGYIDTSPYSRPRFPQPEMVSFVDDTPEVDDFSSSCATVRSGQPTPIHFASISTAIIVSSSIARAP
ncbi:hypothetical protein GQ600_12322 [Phytophthora cactorum]|nr:hypothetical protein GQ600_12322 [Phytophthora cactorum]